MRTFKKLFVAAATLFAATVTMAQNGFNYQAVIRDAQGNLVANQSISLRITLLSGNTVLYVEEKTAATNAYGVVSVVVGEGGAKQGSFNEIDWSAGNISMKTEFDPEGGEAFEVIGTTQLHSVPTAEYAKTTSAVENPKNIKIQATNETGEEEALFEVKDKDGNVVFAVYNDGVRVYVDDTNDGSKAAKSGFAVAGRSGKTGEGNTYFSVNDQGTQVFVDDESDGKAAKAKFAVASVGKSKTGESSVDNYLVVNKQGTKVYVDGDEVTGDKAAKATFAVASVKKGKTDIDNVLVINEEGTKVFVDEADGKAAKAKFAVAGKSGKADGSIGDNYLVINDEGTKVFVDGESADKAAKAKFAVASVRN
ncbi:MAG: hypothetical protein J6U13_10905, partial [Salinivirgaceae bacterium]|nr:hypothetical protein [Salinivirgaceae bacterium]